MVRLRIGHFIGANGIVLVDGRNSALFKIACKFIGRNLTALNNSILKGPLRGAAHHHLELLSQSTTLYIEWLFYEVV